MGDIKASPRNRFLGLLADSLQGASDFASKPFGYDNPPVQAALGLLGIPALTNTVNELSYGGALGTGSGMTWKPKADTVDALMVAAPLGATAGKAAIDGGVALAKKAAPAIERAVPRIMERGGLPAQLLGDMSQGTTSNIFIGPKAKTWDAAAAAKAQEMAQSGVEPRTIWSETGTWKGPDGHWRQEIPDNLATMKGSGDFDSTIMAAYRRGAERTGDQAYTTTVNDVMFHPQLGEAYPNIANAETQMLPFGHGAKGELGMPDGENYVLRIAPFLESDKAKSTILHEAQHAVQGQEGWVNGGSSSAAPLFLKNARDEALSPLYRGKANVEELNSRAAELSQASYLKKLQDLSVKPGLKPSQITNMSPWYEHSDKIRSAFGPMPNKAGPARDAWLNNAAGMMFELESRRAPMSDWRLRDYLQQDLSALKSKYAKVDRERQKFLPEARQYYETQRNFDEIAKLSDFEQYRRIAGEAEARATQARAGMNAAQRRGVFPEDSYDVPISQLILKGAAGGLLKP